MCRPFICQERPSMTRTPNPSFSQWFDPSLSREFWFPSFPILVYFKEDQTRPEGQIHFFPVLFNGKQLFEVMSERFNKPESD